MLSGQRRALLEDAMRCLANAVATEQMMAKAGLDRTGAYASFCTAREQLAERVQAARAAWRDEQYAPAPAAPAPAVPTVYLAIPPFTRTLGAARPALVEGEEVANLQRLLNLEGYQVSVTGHYDVSTTLAVRKLQNKYKLKKQDGIVNVETRQLLNRLTGHDQARPVAPPRHPGVRVSEETRLAFEQMVKQPPRPM